MTQQEWDAYDYHRKRGCKRKADAAILVLAAGFTAVRLLWIRARAGRGRRSPSNG